MSGESEMNLGQHHRFVNILKDELSEFKRLLEGDTPEGMSTRAEAQPERSSHGSVS
jgi:hypothetical protein